MARTLSRLLWWKLVGNLSKLFASGRSTSAWHSGQRNFPFRWLISACFFKHSQQNVWRQVIVLGSVKVSRQIEQVTCSLRFFNKDSMVRVSFYSDRTHPILVQCDSGKLGPYKALLLLQNQFAFHFRQLDSQPNLSLSTLWPWFKSGSFKEALKVVKRDLPDRNKESAHTDGYICVTEEIFFYFRFIIQVVLFKSEKSIL